MSPEPNSLAQYEMIDGPTLALRRRVSFNWVRKQTASPEDPLPHIKTGRYVVPMGLSQTEPLAVPSLPQIDVA